MKILLLGGSGLLGSEIKKVLTQKKFNFKAPSSKEVNVLNLKKTQDYIKKYSPDLIIYSVAYTAVDLAEKEVEKCENLNFSALKNISNSQIPIIHFSTEYVFSAPLFNHFESNSESKYFFEIPENFERKALNVYGNSKIKAEKLLEENFKNNNLKFWNIRTSWLFGASGKNFITTILKISQEKKSLNIVDDQFGRPTFAKDLAESVVQNFIEKSPECGNYHLQNSGEIISWENFSVFFLKEKNIKIKINPIKTSKLNLPAHRPENSILKNTKNIPDLRNWKDACREFLKEL